MTQSAATVSEPLDKRVNARAAAYMMRLAEKETAGAFDYCEARKLFAPDTIERLHSIMDDLAQLAEELEAVGGASVPFTGRI